MAEGGQASVAVAVDGGHVLTNVPYKKAMSIIQIRLRDCAADPESMRFEFFIASRYLRAKRKQAVIGLITVISIAGVTAGVASLIIALAINNGFRQDLQERLLGASAHVSLLRVENDGIHNWQPLLERLEKQPGVVAGAPAIYEQVLVSRGARARGAILKGILPRYEARISDLLSTVRLGSVEPLEAPADDRGTGSSGTSTGNTQSANQQTAGP